MCGEIRRLCRAADGRPGALAGQSRSARIEEESRRTGTSGGQHGAGTDPVCIESLDREGSDGHDPLLASFSEETHDGHLPIEIEIVGAQGDGLGHASTRGVQELQQRGVAQPDGRIVGVRRVQQPPNLVNGQGFGKMLALARGTQLRRHIDVKDPLRQRIPVQPPDCRTGTCNRRCGRRPTGHLAGCEPGQVFLNVVSADIRERFPPPAFHVAHVA